MKKEQKLNLIMIGITAAAAVLFIISLCIFLSSGSVKNKDEELKLTAGELLVRNFNVAYYYGIASLSPKPDYNPEDYPEGVAPCDTNIFKNAAELTSYISSTFVPEEANRIVSASVNGVPRYFEQNGELCMAVVSGDTSYGNDFSKATYRLENIKKDSASIVVTVPTADGASKSTLNLTMVKIGDKWLLTKLTY